MILKRNFEDRPEFYRKSLKVALEKELNALNDIGAFSERVVISPALSNLLKRQHIVTKASDVTRKDIEYLYNVL